MCVHTQETEKIKNLIYGFSLTGEANSLSFDKSNPDFSVENKLGFEVGGSLFFNFSDRFKLKSGIGFLVKKYTFFEDGFILGTDLLTGGVSSSKLIIKAKYGEFYIPLSFQLYPIKDFLFFSIGGGAHYQFMNKTERAFVSTNDTIDKLNETTSNEMNYSMRVGLGYDMMWGKRSLLSIEPFVKAYIKTHIVSSASLINYGLEMSFYF